MKKKLILPTLIVATATLPSLGLVSCNQYEMSETTKAIVDEFIGNEEEGIEGFTRFPRPSNFCYYIAAYLKDRIEKILGTEAGAYSGIDMYNNVWCSIPATEGCKNWKPLILQGHIDMVVAGLTEEESLQKGIDAVIDGSTIHSRDFKTSLGADNGIGGAMMLYLLKTRHEYKHGLIKFIFTADEEVGLIGAHYIDPQVLKDKNAEGDYIPYLLNIDAENKGEIYRSCTGNFLGKFYQTYKKQDPSNGEQALEYPIDIKLDGLAGGHSGIDIGKGRASADRILFELIEQLKANNVRVQLVGYNHEKNVDGQVVDIKWETNQLIQNGHIQFLCDKTHEIIKPILNNCINDWKTRYTGEKVDSWKFDLGSFTWTEDVGFITEADTAKLSHLIGSNNEPTNQDKQKDGMPYGVFQWKEDQKTPKASGNIGPIKISQGLELDEITFEMRDLVRTSVYGDESVSWSPIKMEKNYEEACTKAGVSYKHESGYQPWEYKNYNPLVDFLVNDYREHLHFEPTITDSKGGVEPAEWVTKNPNIICSCIGAHIDNAHTSKETLHLDSIDICLQAVLDTIAWMKDAPTPQ